MDRAAEEVLQVLLDGDQIQEMAAGRQVDEEVNGGSISGKVRAVSWAAAGGTLTEIGGREIVPR